MKTRIHFVVLISLPSPRHSNSISFDGSKVAVRTKKEYRIKRGREEEA
jgi:hypothetical protein